MGANTKRSTIEIFWLLTVWLAFFSSLFFFQASRVGRHSQAQLEGAVIIEQPYSYESIRLNFKTPVSLKRDLNNQSAIRLADWLVT